MIAATIIARNLFEKTQKVALGNIPEGFEGVGAYLLFIINSCITPMEF